MPIHVVNLPPKLARRGRKPLMPHVLTLREASAILRVSADTVKKYLMRGRLAGFRMGVVEGGAWRTTDLAVLAFMGFPTAGFPQIPGAKHPSGAPTPMARVPNQNPRAAARARWDKAKTLRTINLITTGDVGAETADQDPAQVTWQGENHGSLSRSRT